MKGEARNANFRKRMRERGRSESHAAFIEKGKESRAAASLFRACAEKAKDIVRAEGNEHEGRSPECILDSNICSFQTIQGVLYCL